MIKAIGEAWKRRERLSPFGNGHAMPHQAPHPFRWRRAVAPEALPRLEVGEARALRPAVRALPAAPAARAL